MVPFNKYVTAISSGSLRKNREKRRDEESGGGGGSERSDHRHLCMQVQHSPEKKESCLQLQEELRMAILTV